MNESLEAAQIIQLDSVGNHLETMREHRRARWAPVRSPGCFEAFAEFHHSE